MTKKCSLWFAGDPCQRYLPADKAARHPFHWPLEFPEVFARESAGFDAIAGNPPFMRGHDISGALGGRYRDFIATAINGGSAGIADLCSFFVRNSANLLGRNASAGFVATNSISEEDSRKVSLDYLLRTGITIIFAMPNMKWPGKAAVIVSPFSFVKGDWAGERFLNGIAIDEINSSLTAGVRLRPMELASNANSCFVGNYVLGDGFILNESLAYKLIEQHASAGTVILPYVNGVEVNGFSEPKPKRWVICYWDWPIEKAKEIPPVFQHVEDLVKGERASVARDRYKELWWLHAENRPGLYHALGLGGYFHRHPKGWVKSSKRLERVLVKAKTSETWAFEFYSPETIFDQALTVIASDSISLFAVLQSSVHEIWARGSGAGSTMKTDLRYSPAAYETFPLPSIFSSRLEEIGGAYLKRRSEILKTRNIGLTKLCNLLHLKSEVSADISELRALQARMDQEVINCYGFNDLVVEMGFYESAKGERFGILQRHQEKILANP